MMLVRYFPEHAGGISKHSRRPPPLVAPLGRPYAELTIEIRVVDVDFVRIDSNYWTWAVCQLALTSEFRKVEQSGPPYFSRI